MFFCDDRGEYDDVLPFLQFVVWGLQFVVCSVSVIGSSEEIIVQLAGRLHLLFQYFRNFIDGIVLPAVFRFLRSFYSR
ncbi:MAG: hypothetical protein WKF59_21945 [Chitinophagaceae bacterium]